MTTLTEYRYIEIDENSSPHITGKTVSVADVVILRLKHHESFESIADAHALPLASVYGAMTYYYDHQAEIDKEIADMEREDTAWDKSFQDTDTAKLQTWLDTVMAEEPVTDWGESNSVIK